MLAGDVKVRGSKGGAGGEEVGVVGCDEGGWRVRWEEGDEAVCHVNNGARLCEEQHRDGLFFLFEHPLQKKYATSVVVEQEHQGYHAPAIVMVMSWCCCSLELVSVMAAKGKSPPS